MNVPTWCPVCGKPTGYMNWNLGQYPRKCCPKPKPKEDKDGS